MKKKVLITALNSKFIHSNPAIYEIKTAYEKYENDFSVSMPKLLLKEFSVNDTEDSIIYSICEEMPDIIAFSVYIWNSMIIENLCKKIRKISPQAKIILGGPQVSFGIENTNFEYNDYDYLIIGEGERAFFVLISEIVNIKINNPCEWKYKRENKKVYCDTAENPEDYPLIYTEENLHLFDNRIIYYESSRGCPFKCAYCLSSVCGNVRGLSVERVKKDIDFFLTHEIRQVKFVDRTFNYDKKRANEIWEYLIEKANDNKTNFHFEIDADLIDESAIKILSKAPKGLIKFEAGIQSFNEKTLKEINRNCKLEKLSKNLKKIIKLQNINIHSDLIVGLPFEDKESFIFSFNKAYEIGSHQLQLGFLKLLPGAPLNEMIEKHEFVFSKYPPYEIISNKYLSSFDVLFFKKIEDVFERFFNSGRFIFSLKSLEKYFENPFKLFEKISENFKENNLLFSSVSTKNLYCFLHNFFKKNLDENSVEFDKILLLDYYCSERSEQIPIELKYLTASQKHIKEEFLLEHSLKKNECLRIIENEIYIFDYSEKNPVDERYNFTKL